MTIKGVDLLFTSVQIPTSRSQYRIIGTFDQSQLSISDVGGVDSFIEDCHDRARSALNDLQSSHYFAERSWNSEADRVINMFVNNITDLLNNNFDSNKLIEARKYGLQMSTLLDRYKEILHLIVDD